MGCFLGCFGGRKNRRREKRRESYQATENFSSDELLELRYVLDRSSPYLSNFTSIELLDRRNSLLCIETLCEEIPKASLIPITEICDEVEVKCSPSPPRKRVTFDSEVKTYEHIVLQESVELLEEKEEEEKELNSSKTGQSSSENIEIASNSSGSYPSNYRYKSCRESDDEIEEDELDCGESDLDEDEEYYSDDGFSEDKLLKPTEEAYTEEITAKTEEIDTKLKRSNESVRDENHYAQGVLNPVENLTQWKSAKTKGRTIQKQSQKENSNFISDQEDERDSSSFGTNPQIEDITQSFKPKSRIEPKKLRSQERAVDASLSTWLSTSETSSEYNSASMYISTPEKHKSSCYSKPVKNSHDDRPILCALALEDIKQFSATSTPRKSPSKSPDETPIIGTVGGYWSNHSMAIDCGSASSFKGIPNTSSKYREDKSVNWHSTPFEARLEKALNNRDK